MSKVRFQIRVLGPPSVTRSDGEPAPVPIGKPLALLTYLALRDESVSRDHLAEVFWPSVPRARQRASLRQALWLLKKGLGDELFARIDPVELAPDIVEVDLTRALGRAEEGRALEALELWADPPFRDFLLPDVPEWERWTEEQRLRAETRMARALATAAESARERGDLGEAARAFRAAADIEPHRPDHLLSLLRTLLAARELSEAEDTLTLARSRFPDDARALDALESVEAELRALRRGAYSEEREEGVPEVDFVGRVREFAALVRAWERTGPGAGHRAVIVGEAGIGKTRLADEVAAVARSRDGRAAGVKGREGESALQWRAVAELARQLSSLSGAAGIGPASAEVLHTLVPSLRAPGSSMGNGAPLPDAAVVDAVADLVSAVADDGPVLVVVDDLQWVDTPSRNTLVSLARRTEGEGVLWVFTARSGIPDPGLERSLRGLADEGRSLRLRLQPWSEEEVRELLGLLAEFPDAEGLERAVHVIHAAGGGSPLFTVEILKRLAEDEVMVREDARRSEEGELPTWRFHPERLPDRLELPGSVRALLAEQILRLTPGAQTILEALLAGPAVEPETLRHRAELAAPEMTAGLTELLERRLVHWTDGDRLDFAHDEVRSVARSRLGSPTPSSRSLGARIRARPAALAASGAGVLALAILVAMGLDGTTAAPPPPLYGGGTIALVLPDSVLEIVPDHRDPSEWEVRTPDSAPATDQEVHRPYMGADGQPIWFGKRATDEDPPWIVQYLPDGRERVLIRSDRDEFFRAASPDGERILYSSESPDAPFYRLDLWEAALDGSDQRRILAVDDAVGTAAWSPDGTRIAVHVRGTSGTLAILTPDGDPLSETPMANLVGRLDWCGEDHVLVNEQREDEFGLGVFDVNDGTIEPILTETQPLTLAVCSPDGTAVVYPVVSRGEAAYFIHDIQSGRRAALPLVHEWRTPELAWLPPDPSPTPRSLRIAPAPSEMRWGERLALAPEVMLSDGSRIPAEEISWSAGDPSVVSVTPGGRIHANGLGTGWVAATWRDWLTDTIRVEVVGTPGEGTLVADDFRSLETGPWRFVGWPRARSTLLDGEPVLQLLGDGRHWDGIVHTDPVEGSQGLTVELELQLPLTRRDRQWLRLCLLDGELPDGAEDIYAVRLAARQEPCLKYPDGPIPGDNPDRFALSALRGFPGASLQASDAGLPTEEGEWVHIALQLRADGELQLFVNREYVGAGSVLLRNDPDTSWRIGIFGAAVETEGYVRNFAVWQGTRYEGG